ncbi:MAG: polysaccharide pyruvyl transferase family protein [Clostridium sp.]
MDKVGIVTLNGNYNYGNRLQNYALQEVIKSFEYDCETFINTTVVSNDIDETKKEKVIKFIKKPLNDKINIFKKKFNKRKFDNLKNNRYKVFSDFSKKYISETDFEININTINNIDFSNYKYCVTGSDQVWNPNDITVSEINFLTFVPKNKRVTYAPSFGVSEIPEEKKEEYKKLLKGIDNISVREEAGSRIVKELVGKESKVVLDPTMLLTKEEWLNIAKKDVNKPEKRYILTYFLGNVSEEVYKKISCIAKENKFEIVNLANIHCANYFVNGPSEFIDYINSAEAFFTDSFHGCVFSVLLETPLVICERLGQKKLEKMSSRIDTFTKKFDIVDRKFENIVEDKILDMNFDNVKKKVYKERIESLNYLKDRLT